VKFFFKLFRTVALFQIPSHLRHRPKLYPVGVARRLSTPPFEPARSTKRLHSEPAL
jgi:hypothetical protein